MGNKIMQETTPLVECSAFHRGMSVLEASLRNTEDSETIISGLLKGAAEFYGASRASVVEADWDLGIGVITYEWCKDGVPAQRDMLAWAGLLCFERPILTFFGADESLLALARRYMRPIKVVFPLFLFNQMLAAFLRNDGNPGLATLGVLSGGICNIFGDYFFVFPCDMGIYGAGLATALGSAVSFLVMLTHFVSRKNTLRLLRPEKLGQKLRDISVTGFSTFFIDVAMGILTVLFNRQIMRWLSADALAVYGPIIQVSTFVQCCAYSVGQAAQPIISMNYGAARPGASARRFGWPCIRRHFSAFSGRR